MRNDLVKLPVAALPGTSVMDVAGENAIATEFPMVSDAHPVPLQVSTFAISELFINSRASRVGGGGD